MSFFKRWLIAVAFVLAFIAFAAALFAGALWVQYAVGGMALKVAFVVVAIGGVAAVLASEPSGFP